MVTMVVIVMMCHDSYIGYNCSVGFMVLMAVAALIGFGDCVGFNDPSDGCHGYEGGPGSDGSDG
jgi:hypothetical protein